MKKTFLFCTALLFSYGIWVGYRYFPYFLREIIVWQQAFHQYLSNLLEQVEQAPFSVGITLVGVSFCYGLLHALGPGHGKFIIASYLLVSKEQVKSSLLLSFIASLVQGLVAILLVSLLIVILTLSSYYFQLSQRWLERFSFFLLAILGGVWVIKGIKGLRHRPLRIYSIQPVSKVSSASAVLFQPTLASDCPCGHQHIPQPNHLKQQGVKSKLLVILSIGMRPCTGAIFILFFAYMLDIYSWGIVATMAMSLGTAITLIFFALLVIYMRHVSFRLQRWYGVFNPQQAQHSIKLIFGLILLVVALGLSYFSFYIPVGANGLFMFTQS